MPYGDSNTRQPPASPAIPNADEALRVLLVEDHEPDAELALHELRRSTLSPTSRRVWTEPDFREAVSTFKPHVILSDFSMPAFNGLEALQVACEIAPDIPFIFVSGTIGEEVAIDSLKRGATDYILKGNLARLAPAVKRALADAEHKRLQKETEAQLAQTRLRLNSILGSLRDAVWSVSPDLQQVIYVNPAAQRVYGRPIEEFLENAGLWFEIIHPEDKQFVVDAWQQIVRNEPFEVEYRILHPDGSVRWVQDRAQLIEDEGVEARIDCITADITERKLQQERIARLSRIERVLSDINSAIVRIKDRIGLFQEACRIAVEEGGFMLAWIGLLDQQTHEITPQVWSGVEEGLLSDVRLSVRDDVRADQSLAGISIRRKDPVIVGDLADESQVIYSRRLLEGGIRAAIILPLLVEDEARGVFVLYAKDATVFHPDEVKLLTDLSGDISFGLEAIEKQDKLDYLSFYDVLTGLPNRRLFYERVDQALRSAHEGNEKVALLVLDLERFGAISDTLGRHAGDALLKQVAQGLSQALGHRHALARISADAFAALIPDIRKEADIAHVIERKILEAISRPIQIEDHELRLSMKCGVALFPGDGRDVGTLFRNAEVALKRTKDVGDPYLFYEPQMNARIAEKLRLENRLRIAILDEQFVLHYQPKVDIPSNKIVGLEALIRWQSPELGVVPPGEFVPLLEETGMILDVGRWALKAAARDYREWAARGVKPPRIAVNVSALQLRQKNFAEEVIKAVGPENGAASAIDLEVTESVIMENIEESIGKLKAIKQTGIAIAIDDFGTGYSSLSYISRLPVDSLKIDRSFIIDVTNKADNLGIVSTIISLAHSLNLKVIAEGVESQEQLKLLKLLKCDEMQGFLFSRPLSFEQIPALLIRP